MRYYFNFGLIKTKVFDIRYLNTPVYIAITDNDCIWISLAFDIYFMVKDNYLGDQLFITYYNNCNVT